MKSSEFKKFFDVRLSKFKNNQILLNKISERQISTDNQAYWLGDVGETPTFVGETDCGIA